MTSQKTDIYKITRVKSIATPNLKYIVSFLKTDMENHLLRVYDTAEDTDKLRIDHVLLRMKYPWEECTSAFKFDVRDSFHTTLIKDDKGRFFDFKGERIYLPDTHISSKN